MEEIGYDLWLMTRRDRSLEEIRSDLDRCRHGRHSRHGRGQPDPCLACPNGISAGNPRSSLATVIGYGIGGRPITVGEVVTSPAPIDPDVVEALRVADQIKDELFQGRDENDPVTAGEVAERLPEHLRQPYWRYQLARYFATEGLA